LTRIAPWRAKLLRAISAIVRAGASHAPDHGACVARTILQDAGLKKLWLQELDQMRQRVVRLRHDIVKTEAHSFDRCELGYLAHQSGMFSLLPVTPEQEAALTRDHGIHVVQGGRVNLARLGEKDIEPLLRATHTVTQPNQGR
jgi:aspartate/tyrosine/aromatic aminotransferase